MVASLASTGAELLRDDAGALDLGAGERLRVHAVDLDQRPPAADAHRDHQHGAVAEALELGELGRVAVGSPTTTWRHVRVEQVRGGGEVASSQPPGRLSGLSESSSSASSRTHISETSSAPSRSAALRPAVASSSALVDVGEVVAQLGEALPSRRRR